MKKLKVGLFMDDYFPSINGVIMVMDNQAKNMVRTDSADVTVVVPKLGVKEEESYEYKIIRVPSIAIKPIGYSMAMPKLDISLTKDLLKEEFDIIHIHSPFIMGKLAIKIAEKLDIPVVATCHTQFDKDVYKFTKSKVVTNNVLKRISKIYNKCDECWAVNESVADIYKSYGLKIKPGVIMNGTDLKYLNNTKEVAMKVNKKYKIKSNEIVLLFVGRMTIVKNILFILDSLAVMKSKGIKFKMIFAGPFEDKDVFMQKLNDLNLVNDVIIAGKITDRQELAMLFSRAKLFLFPSLYDASSLVQKEAATQKTPTVFIEGSATADNIINNENGFLAPNDHILYAERIIEILNDTKLYDKVSAGAYKSAFKTWEELNEDLMNKYNRVIKNYKGKRYKIGL